METSIVDNMETKEESKSCTLETVQLAATLILAYPAAKEIVNDAKVLCAKSTDNIQEDKRDERGGVI